MAIDAAPNKAWRLGSRILNALLALRNDVTDSLLELLPTEYHEVVDKLVFEHVENARDAVGEFDEQIA